jgi:hypothetical protein
MGKDSGLSPLLKNNIMAVKKKIDLNEDAITPIEKSMFEESHTVEEVEVEAESSLPISLVRKMMTELEDRLTHKFNSLSKKSSMSKASQDLEDDLEYVKDLEDDWLEIPVVFFAFSFNFSIHGDKKRGVESEPPHGAVRFQPLIRTKKKGHKGVQVISVSSVKIQSRSEVDYLRGHSQFGIAFYENMESAMNVDSTWAQKMVEAQQSISRLSDIQIIARAKQEDISVSQSPESMRRQLVEKTAKRAIEQQDRILYGSIRSSVVDAKGRSIVEKTVN